MSGITETIRQIRSYPRHKDSDTGKMQLDAYAWPGGYPLMAVANDGEVVCVDCCNNEEQFGINKDGDFGIAAITVHWEGEPEICCHCNKEIDSAYGPIEEKDTCPECGETHF